jgi:prevent-host-death family protein
MWSVQEAKAKLSEVLRRARAGDPQVIGSDHPCVVVSAEQYARFGEERSLGEFLVDTAPPGEDLELPTRQTRRGDPLGGG